MDSVPSLAGWTSRYPEIDIELAIDATITSWATLAALATTALPINDTYKVWVDSASRVVKAVQLRAGTDATNTADGVQRPNDYHASTNQKVWYQLAI